MSDLEVEKKLMLESHLRRRDITDALVLEAFRTVPREDFLPPDMAEFAYKDSPLPLSENETEQSSKNHIEATSRSDLPETGSRKNGGNLALRC